MPSVSQAQNRAMHAAAEGHSTLGIPEKVGQEFVAADQGSTVSELPKKRHRRGKRGGRKVRERSQTAMPVSPPAVAAPLSTLRSRLHSIAQARGTRGPTNG